MVFSSKMTVFAKRQFVICLYKVRVFADAIRICRSYNMRTRSSYKAERYIYIYMDAA